MLDMIILPIIRTFYYQDLFIFITQPEQTAPKIYKGIFEKYKNRIF